MDSLNLQILASRMEWVEANSTGFPVEWVKCVETHSSRNRFWPVEWVWLSDIMFQNSFSFWGMRVENNSSLASNFASPNWLHSNLKEFKLHTVYSGISELINHLQLVDQAAEFKFESAWPDFKFESKFKPLPSIWQSLPKAIPEGRNRSFQCKINGQAFWAVLLYSLGWSDGQAQTQGISELDCSSCWQRQAGLAWGKKCYHSCDTDLVLELKWFKWPQIFSLMWNEVFDWIL